MDVQDAVKRSIQTEKNAMDFYHLASMNMKNTEARRVFEVLMREEREHAGSFYHIYQGSDIPDLDAFLDTPPRAGEGWISDLEKLLLGEFTERRAMELAMEKEQNLEASLRQMAAKIADPQVRAVFEANAVSTHNHYLLIESEYARLMGMVHETDIDTFVRE
jgi:rubrerythrin